MVNSTPKQPTITLQNIVVANDGRHILNIEDASIPSCGITALIGPNGAGKTTLLKLLHGLIQANSGSINATNLHSALVLHHTPLIRGSTRLNLRIMRDAIPNLTDQDIDQALKEYGLTHLADQVATKLSAGERQRLSLARAKLQNAQLIFLDEPTANLDPHATDQIEALILKMAKQGVGFIIATHDLGQAKRLAENVLLLANGVIAEQNNIASFFENPKTEIAKSFIARQLGWRS